MALPESDVGGTSPPLHAAAAHRPVELNRRFVGVDGLRALAASAVVLFHFGPRGAFADLLHRSLPAAAVVVGEHLDLGVQAFFVISGFVIAHSVRDEPIGARYAAVFAARRCLRLDPPYLCTMALSIALLVASNRALTMRYAAVPTVADVAVNVLYLAGIAHRDFIVGVSWTLALEVQFYLLFIVTLWMARVAAHRLSTATGRPFCAAHVAAPVLAGWAGISIAIQGGWVPRAEGWFVNEWYLFLMGAIVWWVVGKRLAWGWLPAYAGIVLVAVIRRPGPAPVAGVIVAAVIWLTATTGVLTPVLGARAVQSVGRISYSLYLIHGVVGSRLLNLTRRFAGESLSAACVGLSLALAASIAGAWLMYRYVEQPGVRVGRRMKMRHEYAAAARRHPSHSLASPAPPAAGIAT